MMPMPRKYEWLKTKTEPGPAVVKEEDPCASGMAATNGPKIEANAEGSFLSAVKPEPGSVGASPAAQSEDDIYEDTGDLDFAQAGQDLWLCRIPKFLFENWKDLQDGDDEQIRIGTVRVERDEKGGDAYKRISLRLDPDVAHNSSVPKDYVFQNISSDAENMFVFSEKDLPGYKSKGPSDFAPRSYLYEKTKAENKSREEKRKRYEPYVKRAIPKQTALAGAIRFEATCNPVPNEEYRRMMDEQALSRILKKPRAVELDEAQSKQKGLFARGRTELGQDFIRGKPAKGKKGQDDKAARIPENELLDIIIEKFSKYKYWSMRNLRAEIRQPDAYLKQTLEKVAKQIKSGDFANTYTLKNQEDPMTADISFQKIEAASRMAKDGKALNEFGHDGVDDDDEDFGMDDDDDDNVEMEDVKL